MIHECVNKKMLIVCDLDGTLLNDEGVLSEYSSDVINKTLDSQYDFMISTGRSYSSIRNQISKLNNVSIICTYDGACICDKYGNILDLKTVDFTQCVPICKLLVKLCGGIIIYTLVNDKEIIYVMGYNHNSEYFEEFLARRKNKNFIYISSLDEIDSKTIIFIGSIANKEIVENFSQACKKIKLKNCILNIQKDSYIRGMFWIKLQNIQANKMIGINYQLQRIGTHKVIVIGNEKNDLSMFNESFFCVAVGNAINEVKEKASIIVEDNNHDGVAKFLQNIHEFVNEK